MFAYLKILPIVLLLAGAGYAAHWFIVNQLNTQITQLQSDVRQYQAQNVALQSAAEINEQTIRSLEENSQRQVEQMTNLTSANQQLQSEKDEYLSIFRRHDLQRLALARPGLIEPRLNNGTQEVFRQMEEDSREVSTLNE
jgi:predicted PurR-regulated permease PerM